MFKISFTFTYICQVISMGHKWQLNCGITHMYSTVHFDFKRVLQTKKRLKQGFYDNILNKILMTLSYI